MDAQTFKIEYLLEDVFGWTTPQGGCVQWMVEDAAENDIREREGLGNNWYATNAIIKFRGPSVLVSQDFWLEEV